jgi:thymidylate synthase (FAD)
MKIITPSYVIETPREWFALALLMVERAARTCYKSEDKVVEGTAIPFIKKLMMQKPPHTSVIEHFSFSVRFICDRGVSHEIVRHRLASFSQESTRYCNYCKEKFDGHIQLIHPQGLTPAQIARREEHFWAVQRIYDAEIAEGVKPQLARGVLPNALKTEIVVTANLREWQTILSQRTAPMAHPQMRELMVPLLAELKTLVPVIFDDINP